MEQGVSYTYKAAAYPRYRFYQQHLQRLCNRWQNILDAGSLPDCVSRGRIRLKEILSLSKQIEDTVTVNVYADHDFLETSKLLLQCDQKVSGQVGSVSWKNFTEESMKSSETTVTVIVLRSKEDNAISNLKKQLSGVSKEELRKVIIHFVDTQTSVPYNDVVDEKLHQPDVDSVTDKPRVLSIPLNQQIQHLLEESVIFVLERIAEYNKEFILKKQEHQNSDALENAIFTGLMKSMRNTFVVKDLSPDENDKPDEGLKKATDEQLSRLASGIGSNWELLGPSLGVTAIQLDHIKSEHKTVAQQCYHMLILWQQKEGSSLTYILQLLKNLSNVIAVDMTVVKEIEADKPVPSTASDKDKIFHKKLLDFVSKKTKCVVCDKLSLKYGISANLINEFLNEGFFGYEKKVVEMMSTMTLPSWPKDKSDDGVPTCRMFSYRCATNMIKMLREAEDYIKGKHYVLVTLKRLQFQLFGLLQETDVTYETIIPEIPKLPTDLKHDILQISEVYGCGTLWGELVIHMIKDVNQYKRAEIDILLSKYMYVYGYTTEVIDSECDNAGCFGDIEHGHELRAKKANVHRSNEEDGYNYGSVGCFVNVTHRSDKMNVTHQSDKMTDALHALTCAHCVTECDAKVEIKHNNAYVELGEKQHFIYEPNEFDVATIKVTKHNATKCEKALKNSNNACIKSWKFEKTPEVKTPVYKYGCATGLTYGTCISINYQKKMMNEWNGKLENKDQHFDPSNNVLISREDIDDNIQIHGIKPQQEARAGTGEEEMEIDNNKVTTFSCSGDSGAVVCKDGPDNDNCIHVLSLLTGSVKLKTGETYSYSNHIDKTVTELEKRFNCVIHPAQDCVGAERI